MTCYCCDNLAGLNGLDGLCLGCARHRDDAAQSKADDHEDPFWVGRRLSGLVPDGRQASL